MIDGTHLPVHGEGVIIPIRADCIGATFQADEIAVTPRMTMGYAAAIGAVDEIYLDDARPGGVVAPPPFIVAVEWPLMMSPEYLAAIGRDDQTIYHGLVHGFQDTTFHRAIRPGDRLARRGRIVETRQTRAGAIVVCRLESTDAQTGEVVCESLFGSVFRRTPLDGPPVTAEASFPLREEPDLSGGEIAREQIPISRELPQIYTQCADIWNPIHTERSFALASGLPDIILHGTCTWALALQRIAAHLRPGRDMPFHRAATRFSRMVVPGAPVSLEHRVTETGDVAFAVRNADGDLALSEAFAILA